MTQTPQGRNRRADRHNRPEDITPKPAASRTRQPRAPIGRSQELLERQEQLRHSVQPPMTHESVRSGRMKSTYSDFAQRDFSSRAAQPIRKKNKNKHTGLWLMAAAQPGALPAPQRAVP